MTMTHTIQDVAGQLDRLCPSLVDSTISGNGCRVAGHIGHDHDEVGRIGWYCAGGNAGDAVVDIHRDRIGALYERLAAMPDGALDRGGLQEAIGDAAKEWYV